MPVALDPRTSRLLRRVPRTNIYTVAELVLLTLLAVQCARLFWTLLTPVEPVGEWRAADGLAPGPRASPELLGGFDPFFRQPAGAAPLAVTGLDLKLFGVREDRASGRGSAIIGTSGGAQRSYAVGEEIMPGVTLAGVAFDHAVIVRNGAREQLFIDQSAPAETVAPPPAVAMPPAATTPSPPPPADGNSR